LSTISNTESLSSKGNREILTGYLATRTVFIFSVAGHKKFRNKASVKLEEGEGEKERPRVDEKQQRKFTLD